VRRLLLLGTLSLLAASCGGGGGAKVTLDAGTIAFVSTDGGDYAVYLANADREETARLTENPDKDTQQAGTRFQDAPAWAPDGSYLVIDSNRATDYRLYRLDPESGKETDLGLKGADPAFSPDGKLLFDGPAGGLSVANADGSALKQLTKPGQPEIDPAWSPDGKQIAYVVQQRIVGRRLWIAKADGTGAHRLTKARGNETAPAWSPDGKWLAFSSSLPGTQQIYVIRPDGTGLRRVTVSATDDTHPTWSPDGRRIAYARADGLFVIGANGKGAKLVVGGTALDPAWRP
jgi:TolB protein